MNFQSDQAHAGAAARRELLHQRDQAAMAAILAVTLAFVVLWRNFGVSHPELGELRQTITQHDKVLQENQNALNGVHAALLSNQQALAQLRKANPGRR